MMFKLSQLAFGKLLRLGKSNHVMASLFFEHLFADFILGGVFPDGALPPLTLCAIATGFPPNR